MRSRRYAPTAVERVAGAWTMVAKGLAEAALIAVEGVVEVASTAIVGETVSMVVEGVAKVAQGGPRSWPRSRSQQDEILAQFASTVAEAVAKVVAEVTPKSDDSSVRI